MLPPKKTMKRIAVPGTARFLTFSCYRRHRLFENDKMKSRFAVDLADVARRQAVQIVAWVVMPEHVHLVVFTERDVAKFLAALKQPFATRMLRHWREVDAPLLPKLRDRQGDLHFWQAGGGYDRNVIGKELLEKIRYCHANPVTRVLATTSIGWAWSSARSYEHRGDAIGPEIGFDLLPRGSGSLT